jgi:hypothetical protein
MGKPSKRRGKKKSAPKADEGQPLNSSAALAATGSNDDTSLKIGKVDVSLKANVDFHEATVGIGALPLRKPWAKY